MTLVVSAGTLIFKLNKLWPPGVKMKFDQIRPRAEGTGIFDSVFGHLFMKRW